MWVEKLEAGNMMGGGEQGVVSISSLWEHSRFLVRKAEDIRGK